jgi:hypothetical protein
MSWALGVLLTTVIVIDLFIPSNISRAAGAVRRLLPRVVARRELGHNLSCVGLVGPRGTRFPLAHLLSGMALASAGPLVRQDGAHGKAKLRRAGVRGRAGDIQLWICGAKASVLGKPLIVEQRVTLGWLLRASAAVGAVQSETPRTVAASASSL